MLELNMFQQLVAKQRRQGRIFKLPTGSLVNGLLSEEEFTRGMLVLAEGLRPVVLQEVHHEVGVCRVKLNRVESALSSGPGGRKPCT